MNRNKTLVCVEHVEGEGRIVLSYPQWNSSPRYLYELLPCAAHMMTTSVWPYRWWFDTETLEDML